MQKNTIILMAICLIAGMVIMWASIPKEQEVGFGSGHPYVAVDSGSDHGTVWASSTYPHTISANPDREFLRISLVNGQYATCSVFIWQNTSTDSVAKNKGIMLSSSTETYYQIDGTNLYKGALQILSTGDSLISWIEQP